MLQAYIIYISPHGDTRTEFRDRRHLLSSGLFFLNPGASGNRTKEWERTQ